jgi:hypothetical protein
MQRALWNLGIIGVVMNTIAGSAFAQTGATLTSDKPDYEPGEVAVLTGAGFWPGEVVDVSISVDDPETNTHIGDYAWTDVYADADGGFIVWYTVPEEAAGMTLTATAMGLSSALVATVSFTDSVSSVGITSPTGASPVTITSLPANVTITFDYSTSSGGTTTGEASVQGTPAVPVTKSLAPGSGKSDSIVVAVPAITANGSYTVKVTVTNNFGTGANNKTDTKSNAVIINVPLDTTPPVTTAALSGTPGSNEWYTSSVAVTLSATDAGTPPSGVAHTYYTVDGGSQQTYIASFTVSGDDVHTVQYWSVDVAGNTETQNSRTIKIDTTPPTISGSASPAANGNGWNNSTVEVSFTASDTLSGVDTVSGPTTLSGEGANQSAQGTATDMAGNSASTTVSGINIDKTPPTIAGTQSPPANPNGWNNSEVTVSFTAEDALSGIDTVSGPTALSGEGAGQSVVGTATDKAGNTASATVSGISIDKTPPTIEGSRTPDANANGWNNTDVTVSFTAADSLSGVDMVSDPTTLLSDEGAEQSVTGTATDMAGNTASATVSGISIDKTPPSITSSFDAIVNLGTIVGALSGRGFSATVPVSAIYSYEDAMVKATLTPPNATANVASVIDALSGVDGDPELGPTEPVELTLFGPGPASAAFTVEISATDRAGNSTLKFCDVEVTGQVVYDFVGFLPPLRNGVANLVKRNSCVPVKFQLLDCNGVPVTTGDHTIAVYYCSGNSPNGDPTVDDSGGSGDNGTLFRWSDPNWIYNLKTNGSYAVDNTYRIVATLDDGTIHDVHISIKK